VPPQNAKGRSSPSPACGIPSSFRSPLTGSAETGDSQKSPRQACAELVLVRCCIMLWPAVGADRQTISQLLRGQVAKQGLGCFLRPTLASMSGWRLDVPRHPFQIKTHLAILEQGFAPSLALIHSLGVITLLTCLGLFGHASATTHYLRRRTTLSLTPGATASCISSSYHPVNDSCRSLILLPLFYPIISNTPRSTYFTETPTYSFVLSLSLGSLIPTTPRPLTGHSCRHDQFTPEINALHRQPFWSRSC
jgi:hypothetical protein